MAHGLDVLVRNARLNAFTTYAGNSGKLRGFSGTRPATGGAITTLLFECTMNATSFPAAGSGTMTANAITGDASADATGTATWGRLYKSDGTTIVTDFDIGTSGADCNLSTTAIVATATVNVTSWTFTEGNP